jgi:hypothetical protein
LARNEKRQAGQIVTLFNQSKYLDKGRPRRLTLGPWPYLNVVLARERALEIRSRIAKGEDPATDAAEARRESIFGELVSTYMERHAKPHKRSARQDEKSLQR